MTKHKEFIDNPETFSRIITKDNIALIIIFQIKNENKSLVSNTLPQSDNKTILISNTHIHWNPENKDIKLMQVNMLLEKITQLTSPKSKWFQIPMILCGDFNSLVESGPYELLSTGSTGGTNNKYFDLDPYNYGNYSLYGMKHSLPLSSAYAPIGEPPFTNYTGK